jgi:hypothetical protein
MNFALPRKPCPQSSGTIGPQREFSKNEKPEFGPSEVRTFCRVGEAWAYANFAFVAELSGTKPPDACERGGPSPAKTIAELLTYLRLVRGDQKVLERNHREEHARTD